MRTRLTTLTAVAAFMLPLSLQAQTSFERTYGGTDTDYGYAAAQTSDGGYITTGYTFSFGAGNADVYLIKSDTLGDTLWTRTYGGIRRDRGRAVQQTAEGGFVIVGQTLSFGSGKADVYLVKTDADGETLWTQAVGDTGSDWGESIQQTSDSGYIIAGTTESRGAGARDVYLVRTDGNGDTLWTKTFGGANDDCGESVRQTADGGYIVAGYTYSPETAYADVYLIKTDAMGDTTWTRTFGGDSNDYGYSVIQTSDSGYIVVGSTASRGAGGLDIYLVKIDPSGDTLWTRTFGAVENQEGWSVQQTMDCGYIVAGYTLLIAPALTHIYLVKIDEFGNAQWDCSYHAGPGWNYAYSVQQTADSGYIVAGATVLGNNDIQAYLIKTDSLGQVYVGVEEPEMPPTRAPGLSLSCFPNPTGGSVTISLAPSIPLSLSSVLRLFDASGRLVLSQPVRASSFILHPSSLPAGVYLVRLDCGSQHASTRLVVQR